MNRRIYSLLGIAAVVVALLVAVGNFSAHELKAAPGVGTLFGTDPGGGGNLIMVNTATGAGALVANLGLNSVPSLAVDPTTGIMYAGTGAGNPRLFTVTPAGVATLVGNTGLGFAAVGGMDFRADGTLFAAVNIAGDGGTGSDHLATINTATGQATIIGPFGACTGVTAIPVSGAGFCNIEGMEGIAFNSVGALFGTLSARGAAGARGLYSINSGTGAAAFVAPILDVAGAPPSGGVVGLQFRCDGTLFGGTATAIAAADGGFLVKIDPLTGLFNFVGGASATGTKSLAGLAFIAPCSVGGVTSFLADGSGSSAGAIIGFTAAAATIVALVASGAWYSRRRRQGEEA